MPVYNPNPHFLNQAIQSVIDQHYPNWELCIADDASTTPGVKENLQQHSKDNPNIKVIYRDTNGHISAASKTALEMAKGDFIVLLDHDDRLHPLALYEIAIEINRHPEVVVIYSDEDKITPRGSRIDPYFKSDFDIDLFLSQNMVSHLGVYRRDYIMQIGGFREGLEGSQDYDLLLRLLLVIDSAQIQHIPKVLYHWRISEQSVADRIDIKPYALEAGRKALSDYLSAKNIEAQANTFEDFGYKIRYALPDPKPSVEIFLVSDKPVSPMLETCSRLIERADYDIEKITLSITSSENKLDLLETSLSEKFPQVQVSLASRQPGSPSKLNQAIRHSAAEYIAIIDDTCVDFSQAWLKILLAFAAQPGIGCVSPKLATQNGVIFSCGLILNDSGSAHRLFNSAAAGRVNYYFGWSSLHKGYSALPDQCVLINKTHFLSLGGYHDDLVDPSALQVDLCLKMKEAGLRNVVVPEAMVTVDPTLLNDHRMDVINFNQTDRSQLLGRWKKWFEDDPAFNPNLILRKGKPTVSTQPSQSKLMIK
jgi:glycosyltransferase involved in cell wall biosynthesis